MDRKLKAILDEFLPYTDDEYPSVEKWEKKTARRKELAAAIIAYKEHKVIEFPALQIDMKEVMKRMNDLES